MSARAALVALVVAVLAIAVYRAQLFTVSRPGFLAVPNKFTGIHPSILRPWVLWRGEEVSVQDDGSHAAVQAKQTGGRG